MNYKILQFQLFTFSQFSIPVEEQKAAILTKLYSVHRHELMPLYTYKKFMGNHLNDAYKMLKCLHYSAHYAATPEARQYIDALTNYISENCMYEMVLRKSRRFFRLRNNKLPNAIIALRNAIEAISKINLVAFDVEQEFIKTTQWFTQANTEYFKRIGLKK